MLIAQAWPCTTRRLLNQQLVTSDNVNYCDKSAKSNFAIEFISEKLNLQ